MSEEAWPKAEWAELESDLLHILERYESTLFDPSERTDSLLRETSCVENNHFSLVFFILFIKIFKF